MVSTRQQDSLSEKHGLIADTTPDGMAQRWGNQPCRASGPCISDSALPANVHCTRALLTLFGPLEDRRISSASLRFSFADVGPSLELWGP